MPGYQAYAQPQYQGYAQQPPAMPPQVSPHRSPGPDCIDGVASTVSQHPECCRVGLLRHKLAVLGVCLREGGSEGGRE